jgi:hypothetical protein
MSLVERMEELRREREGPQATENDLQRDPPLHRTRSLTAVWQGKIRRLIINLPPRHGWPAVRDWRRIGAGPPIRPDAQLASHKSKTTFGG